MTTAETVQLRTGEEVPRSLVLALTDALRTALRREPMTLMGVVEMAHTGEPQPFSAQRLEALGFTQQGQMHGAIREVVLASTQGRGLDITLVDPVED